MPSNPRLLALRDEQPVDAEDRGEQERHPQDAGGELALEPVAVEAEVEDDEGRDGEQRHRRHRLLRAKLDAQVLADDRADRAHGASSAAVERAHLRTRLQPGAAR